MAKIQKYRDDHEDIRVFCPKCSKLIRGWTYTGQLKEYWLSHAKPRKERCIASEEEMTQTKLEWDKKYIWVEETL